MFQRAFTSLRCPSWLGFFLASFFVSRDTLPQPSQDSFETLSLISLRLGGGRGKRDLRVFVGAEQSFFNSIHRRSKKSNVYLLPAFFCLLDAVLLTMLFRVSADEDLMPGGRDALNKR